MKNMMIRQGDVQIIRIAGIPEDAEKTGEKVLAYGEVTGHKHRIDVGDLFRTKNGEFYLRVEELTTVRHEEHRPVTCPRGDYQIKIKRQYTPEGWENTRD